MSSIEPSIDRWHSVTTGQQVEIALLQVEIAYDSRLYTDYPRAEVERATDEVKNFFQTIAEARKGRTLFWEGNAGGFMFLVDAANDYELCCTAAIQMLEAVPSLNEIIQESTGLRQPIEIRISCDSGSFTFDKDPSKGQGEFVKTFIRHERQVSAANRVTTTERVYRQLSYPFKSRFLPWKYSPELQLSMYATPSSQDTPIMQDAPPSFHDAPADDDRTRPPQSNNSGGSMPKPESATSFRRSRGPGILKAVGLAAAFVVLGGVIIFQALVLMKHPAQATPAPPVAVATPGDELVNTAEWRSWRSYAHEKLSAGNLTNADVIEIVRARPVPKSNQPSVILRHDLAIADVLFSYKNATDMLALRFGIYQDVFLGTGFSNPLEADGYGLAAIHEYLVPNERVEHENIWMRRFAPTSEELDNTISDLVNKEANSDAKNMKLRERLVTLMKEKNWEPGQQPVIRFAIFDPERDSHRLGREEAYRVFASDLAEVWALKFRDAARRSGRQLKSKGPHDMCYVWIFLPKDETDVVPATWTEVLNHLPDWLNRP